MNKIIFHSLQDDNTKIHYYSANNNFDIIIEIREGHSKFLIYKSKHTVNYGITYFTTIPWKVSHLIYTIFDAESNKILLNIECYTEGATDYKKLDVKNVIHNYKNVNKNDTHPFLIFDEIFNKQIYSKNGCIVNEGDVVVDIGGNIGMFTCNALCKGPSKIYYFEPILDMYNAAYSNLSGFNEITFENVAVSDKNGTIPIYYNNQKSGLTTIIEDNSIDVANVNDGNFEKLECKSINFMEYLIQNNINHIDYLKVDCEGAEYSIFNTIDSEYMKNINKIAMEFHNNFNNELKIITDKLDYGNFSYIIEYNENLKNQIGMLYAVRKHE